ncbi:MAG: 4Fe-4S dicluster domain-containing protein [Candidatus Muirbacterium halophilum]|nr:4Fe-4S dicluster domain-containing protein [Candidatus Muirbacterium halophilum]MCK9475075.1 4Fe-4S dicluster domain-containing protein [Candidatus Muirbacterium halophilum]
MAENIRRKNNKYFHSVRLKEDLCVGCTHCLRTCPTEAIRVIDGKAVISEQRCIDCGECIRTCPTDAKYALTSPFKMIENFKYRVALPAPSFMAQFDSDKISLDKVYTALNLIGFQYIFEVAAAAELVNFATEQYLKKTKKKPLISSACPAVIRLILTRFPEYVDNIAMLEPPMDIAAKISKELVMEKEQAKESEVGVFFISPCAAKVTAVKEPAGKEKSPVTGVFSMTEIYDRVMSVLKDIKKIKKFEHAGKMGIIWGVHEGELQSAHVKKKVAVAGIHNVISFFENIGLKVFNNLDFIEAQACIPGCVGGVLAPTDKFLAKIRLKELATKLKISQLHPEKIIKKYNMDFFLLEKKPEPRNISKLDTDLIKAMEKSEQIDQLTEEFPGIDCGICGCPTCRALAEDIVLEGKLSKFDCIFILKQKIKNIKDELESNDNFKKK